MATLSPMLPAAPQAPDDAPAGLEPKRWWAMAVALTLLVALVTGAALLPAPYVALRPGSVRPVSDQVVVDGVESFPPEASIAYTTVNVGSITALEAMAGWLDDDIDVRPEEIVRGGRSAEENRRYNAELMDSSKAIALTVALERLGYEVTVRTSGAVVRDFAPDSPAAAVLEIDDVIVAVDDEPVDEPGELGPLLQAGGVGASHVLTVERPPGSGTTVEVSLATVAAPDDPERAIIGVLPQDRLIDFEFPIDVTIDSGTVGGPSAGLAFTLAVLDVLTPGELTGGRQVAVTGTMALDGTVGPVGGGAQKAVAVRDAGYAVFLVPSSEVEEVRAAVGDDLEVVGVDTLDQALEALDSLGGDAGTLLGAVTASSR